MYSCSLSELLYPDSDSEPDIPLNFGGDGRGFCDREDNRRGDLCLTALLLLSIMCKSSITRVF